MNSDLKSSMHPIILSPEKIDAIAHDDKTTIRYLIKPQPYGTQPRGLYTGTHKEYLGDIVFEYDNGEASEIIKAPYRKEEILFVKEVWMIQSMSNYDKTAKILFRDGNRGLVKVQLTNELYDRFLKYSNRRGWLSPVFMPREIARYILRVTDVRAERLQSITESDAGHEVISSEDVIKSDINRISLDYRSIYARYWDFKHQDEDLDRYGWDANPFVIGIDFEKQEIPKAAITPTMPPDADMKVA